MLQNSHLQLGWPVIVINYFEWTYMSRRLHTASFEDLNRDKIQIIGNPNYKINVFIFYQKETCYTV
jgi:hypothetical protein